VAPDGFLSPSVSACRVSGTFCVTQVSRPGLRLPPVLPHSCFGPQDLGFAVPSAWNPVSPAQGPLLLVAWSAESQMQAPTLMSPSPESIGGGGMGDDCVQLSSCVLPNTGCSLRAWPGPRPLHEPSTGDVC
jgi:hypothetical protein